ncbi:uncharacterized protein A4U43_C07F27800 [Asparagus officinalis]|uniref:Uncharacterized protein n=1 Tax=Asparagus officinalis TaxID=4686 RepID=A0A5P1EHC9_ASPOF|nr:uncharacterized protein A4U43_C07F27800 [Asparagus officinalis]
MWTVLTWKIDPTQASWMQQEIETPDFQQKDDNIDAASKEEALRATQDAADDPHFLSREENDTIAMNVIGYNNRGRFPLMGVGAMRGTSRISSMASSPTSTATGSSTRSPTTSVILRVSCYLRVKTDSTLLMQLMKDMFSDLPPSTTSDDVFTHIILCLSDKIPAELFREVLALIDLDTSAQVGLAGGSSSGVQRRDIDDDDDDS